MKGFGGWGAALLALVLLATGCGGTNYSVQPPTGATIVSLAPSGAIYGGGDFTLTVFGAAYNPFPTTTVVEWNGQKLSTNYLSGTQVSATVPASLIAKSGTVFINTYAPQSGSGQNGLSNSFAFLIYGQPNPLPTLSTLTPDTTTACGTNCSKTSLEITVTGSNFLPTSTNGPSMVTIANQLTPYHQDTSLTIKSITDSEIKATIPGTFLANADVSIIKVINPPSGVCLSNCPDLGGGESQPMTLTITGSSSAAAAAEETPAVSEDGRYVAYTSVQNDLTQVYLRDTCVGAAAGCSPTTKLVSAASDGTAGNQESHMPSMSADGRYVAFSSAATNLAEGAPAGRQVYLHDTCIGAGNGCKETTTLISVDPEGHLAGTESILPSISSNGRYVAFVAVTPDQGVAANPKAKKAPAAATATVNSGLRQVFLRDTCLGTANCTPKTTRISTQPGDAQSAPSNPSAKPAGPALSGQARQVALSSGASATVLTKTTPVDENVFLAATGTPK